MPATGTPAKLRNRVPKLRSGVRDWSRFDLHERAVLAALYATPKRADGLHSLTRTEIQMATGISGQPLDTALRQLQDGTRCARVDGMGAAVMRGERACLPPLYSVTPSWGETHRTPARNGAAAAGADR